MKRVTMRRRRGPSTAGPIVVATLLGAAAIIALGWAAHAAPAFGAGAGDSSKSASDTAAAAPASAAQRACTPGDLAIGVGGTGAYRGQATQEVTLTNRAADACFLPGAPSTTLVFDDGSQQAAALGQSATSRVDLAPGQSALELVGTPGTCTGAGPSRSKVATKLALGMPGGGSMHAEGAYLDVQCGQPSVLLVTAAG